MLDTKTLMMVLGVVATVNAGVFTAIHFKRFQVSGTASWAWGLAIVSAGLILLWIRGMLPQVAGVVLANIVILAGYLLLCRGLYMFVVEKPPPRSWCIGAGCLIAATAVFMTWLLAISPTKSARIIIVSIALGLPTLATARVMLIHGRGMVGSLTIGLGFLGYGLLCMARAVYHLFWRNGMGFFDSPVVSLFFLYTVIFGLATTIGLIFMISEKLHSRLAEQNRVLKENIRLRDEVESITRHDLKTPIVPIVQALGYLLTDFDLAPDVRELVAKSKRSALDALDMINRSLDVYRLEHGCYRLAREPVDLARQLARAAADMESSPLRNKGVAVDLRFMGRPLQADDSLVFQGEGSLVYSMMANLLKNAVEASPKGEKIEASLERNGDKAVLCVENKGEVPVQVRQTLFDKFTTSGKSGGTGLGAYSARLMAEEHGGGVRLDDSVPGTVRVIVTLPLSGKREG